MKFVPLNKRDHAQKCWKQAEDYSFAAREAVLPLVGAELSLAASEMPTGFVKDGTNFRLVAILSIRPLSNLFVGPKGKWLANHLPMLLRTHPFRLLPQQGQENMLLCLDQESTQIDDGPDGERIFDDKGELSPPVQNVLNFLERYRRSRVFTDMAVAALGEASLIIPWTVTVKDGQSKGSPLKGIFRIDEMALNKIDDETFLKLRKSRALAIAYGQLFSTQQISKLGPRLHAHEKLKTHEEKRAQLLNEMFKLDDGLIPL